MDQNKEGISESPTWWDHVTRGCNAMKEHILWAAERCAEREADGQKPTARDEGDDSICKALPCKHADLSSSPRVFLKKKKSHSGWRALVIPVLRRWIHSNPWNSLVNQSSLLSEFQDCFKNGEQLLRANTWGWPLASVNVHCHTQMCTFTNIHEALRFNYLWIWLSWDISF